MRRSSIDNSFSYQPIPPPGIGSSGISADSRFVTSLQYSRRDPYSSREIRKYSCGEIQSAGRQPGAGKVSQVRVARRPGPREASARYARSVIANSFVAHVDPIDIVAHLFVTPYFTF